MDHEARWFNEQRWRTRRVLLDLVGTGAKGVCWLGLVGALGFALTGAVQGYEGWIGYGMMGSLVLSVLARVVKRKTSQAGYGY